jgi:dTDP-4-amino-4,6-dideoxygalactose transaminase
MKIPLVDLKAQYATLKPQIDAAMARVIDRCSFILGEEVSKFERSFADFCGVTAPAVGVASGTAALHLSLLACKVGPGDEVITTSHTFTATAEAIVNVGARPIFVDIDPNTYAIDPKKIAEAVTPKTKAIIPVHIYGHPADMDPIMDLAGARKLYVIEDAAQAHGAAYKGKTVGGIGHLGCFSFYPGKNLGAFGDAGAVTGTDEELLARVRRLRDHGRTTKYEHIEVGWGERIDALQAAILDVKLTKLDAWNEGRRANARKYSEALADGGVGLPVEVANCRHVYHLYVIRTPKREALLKHLQAQGIGAGIHYPIPLHLQPAYRDWAPAPGKLAVTERLCQEVLSLPMYPELDDEKRAFIVGEVLAFQRGQ